MDPTRYFGATQQQGSANPPAPSDDIAAQARSLSSQDTAGLPGRTAPPGQASPDADPNGQPQDEQQRARDEHEARMRQLEQENQQLRGTFNQVEQWAQQQAQTARQQQFQGQVQQRLAGIRQTAENMSAREAVEYQNQESARMMQDLMGHMSQQEQQMQQRLEQERRMLATPLYARKLVEDAGLPADVEQRLLEIGDPDMMTRLLPGIQREHQERQRMQEQLDQIARTTQANQMVRQGAGIAGGTIAPPSIPIPDDADPDTKAKMIYADIMRQRMATG